MFSFRTNHEYTQRNQYSTSNNDIITSSSLIVFDKYSFLLHNITMILTLPIDKESSSLM